MGQKRDTIPMDPDWTWQEAYLPNREIARVFRQIKAAKDIGVTSTLVTINPKVKQEVIDRLVLMGFSCMESKWAAGQTRITWRK